MRIFILKPDNIGDFLLASGAVRLLADTAGEENVVLAVKSDVAPLAAREFPRARIVPLPIRAGGKPSNPTVANFFKSLPVLIRLIGLRVDVAVCLRDKRSFLQTLLFLAPRSGRRVACENSLLRGGGRRRGQWESAVRAWFRPVLLPYPDAEPGLPSDLVAHRVVVSELLGRPVSSGEIMPRLAGPRWTGGDHWMMCPLSSKLTKDFAPHRWAEALREVADLIPSGGLRLAGAPDQAERLKEFAAALRSAGVACPLHVDESVALPDFPASMARAALILTVDTSAAHLACAIGAPAVIVVSGHNMEIYGGHSPNGRQEWVMGAWARGRKRNWQETVPNGAVVAGIRRALA